MSWRALLCVKESLIAIPEVLSYTHQNVNSSSCSVCDSTQENEKRRENVSFSLSLSLK